MTNSSAPPGYNRLCHENGGRKRGGEAPVEYELYVDVLFLSEACGSFLALYLLSAMAGWPFKPLRAAAAASFAGIWTCFVTVFPVFPLPLELALTVAGIGSAMTAFTFCLKGFRAILKADFLLAGACALMAGAMTFLKQFFYLPDFWAAVSLGAFSWGAGLLLGIWRERTGRGKARLLVRLYYKGNMREFRALCDSGNRLFEPVTGKPVSVISYVDCRGFCESVASLLFIPYRAVGTESGVLPGIVFEKMEIFTGERQFEITKPVVAVVKAPLSENGDFTMLLPEALISS